MREATDCICMYTPSAGGGHARYTQELMTAMARHPRARHRFELVSSTDLEAPFRQSDAYRVHAVLPPIRERGTFRTRAGWAVSRVTHYARREWQFLTWLRARPDVVGVHMQEWTPWLAAPLIRRIRRMGKRVFYTVHNITPHRYPRHVPKAVVHRWIRSGCRACDGLFVHTERLAGELAQFLGEPHPPIRVVPHGVWTAPGRRDGGGGGSGSGHPASDSLERRLAWRRLLFFGSIRRNKGLHVLLRAAEELPGYGITVAGEVEDRDYFQAEILPAVAKLRAAGVRLDLRDWFVPDEEVAPLFATHSAVVLPYTREFVAQSGVAFMAMAHGLPVVASEAGGLGELLGQSGIGTTFRDGTPQGLAAAVRALCEGEGGGGECEAASTRRREDLAARLDAARQRYSWQEAAAGTIAGYCAPTRGEMKGVLTDECPATTVAAQ
jgi:glycosyltransferase involved in cell wall biosynthesis